MPDQKKKNPGRRRKHPGHWKNNKDDTNKPKKPRNNLLWREGDANTKIHPGSYAHAVHRDAFPVSLPSFDDSKPTIKRKVAMLIGYKGTNYCGFQINESQRTIQAELELAMYKAGMVRPDNFGIPHKYGWSTSGRTDKGVHAAAQTISCKVELPAIEMEASDNKGESSKEGNPKEEETENTVDMAKVAPRDEEKPGKEEQEINEDKKTTPSKTLAANALELARERMNEALPDDITVMAIQRTTRGFCAKTQRDKVRYHYILPSFMIAKETSALLKALVPEVDNEDCDEKNPLSTEELDALRLRAKEIRSTPDQRNRLQTALLQYIGTKSFHNFTKGLTSQNASATRYIMAFDVHEPVYDPVSQMEWIPTTVTGQSFLIHQIRKMIGAAMEIAREAVPDDYIERALNVKQHVPVPVAPATGLFLEQSWYDSYNRRKKVTKASDKTADDTPDLDWTQEGPVLERWKECVASIQKHIMIEEKEQGSYWRYLYIQDRVFSKRHRTNDDQNKSSEEPTGPSRANDAAASQAIDDATKTTTNSG